MVLSLNLWELSMMEQNGKRPKEPHGLRTRYFSRYIKFDVMIPAGMLSRLKIYLSYRWKTLAWRTAITMVAFFPTIYGISLGNMTIADKQRLSVLESKAENFDRLDAKVKAFDLKIVDYDARLKAAEDKITGYQEISESDGFMLLRQQEQERDRKRKRELEQHNKARAEKLRRIGQGEQLANPQAPATSIYSPVKN